MLDQIALLKPHRFPTVMMLPCADPRDAKGLEYGAREFVDKSGIPLILYLKDEPNFGTDLDAGLDVVGRLVAEKYCVGIKYAVVRQRPSEDRYLEGLLKRVDRSYVISGIGERPAIVHMREWALPGFTTGSGCVAPALTQRLYELNVAGKWDEAEAVRQMFIPLEDLRDAWGPARVLHAATDHAHICKAGPIRPYISEISADQHRPARADRASAARCGDGRPHGVRTPDRSLCGIPDEHDTLRRDMRLLRFDGDGRERARSRRRGRFLTGELRFQLAFEIGELGFQRVDIRPARV